MSVAPEGNVSDCFAGPTAVALTNKTLVFDCLSLFYILDEPYATRCLESGVNGCNVTFAAESDWDQTLANFAAGLEKIAKNPLLRLAATADDVVKAQAQGKLAVFPGTQGASFAGTDLKRIGLLHRLGLRFIGLAYTGGNLFGDGCGERRNAGLTFLGMDFVDAVNELPLILDLSHCGHQTRAEATARARAPVCTHSNAYAVAPNDRNTTDDTAKAIAAKGGAVGICALPKSVHPRQATIDEMLRHHDHYVKLVGPAHVGIGLDFIEAYKDQKLILPESRRWRTLRPDIFGTVDEFLTMSYPTGLDSIRLLPNYTQRLLDRGYGESEIAGFLGGNWLAAIRRFVG